MNVSTQFCEKAFRNGFLIFTLLGITLLPITSRAESLSDLLLATDPKLITVPGTGTHSYRLRVWTITDKMSPRLGVQFLWIRIPLSDIDVEVKDVQRSDKVGQVFQSVTDRKDVVVVNGGFWDWGPNGNESPTGLVISNGATKSLLQQWNEGGVLFVDQRGPKILKIKHYHTAPSIRHAIQTHPMLVYRGKNDMISDDQKYFNRAAIALTADRQIIVAALVSSSEEGGSLYELAELLITSGTGAYSSLAMDGGPGAHLFFPSIEKHFGYSGKNFVPNTVHIRLR